MKFTNGFWMNRPEVRCTDTVQLREIRNEGDRIYIYSVPYSQDSRALGGPLVEIFISSPPPLITTTPRVLPFTFSP